MVTAYDYPSAQHADRAGIDMVLVGDSLGMVILGHETTQAVTVPQMIHHCQAVKKALSHSFLIGDMPFGSYEDPGPQAARTARELVKKAAVDAVKLEGGVTRAPAIRDVVSSGIAVMAHIGLAPQTISALGGFRAMGKNVAEACGILDDALAVQEAGAFAVVLECVPARLAKVITERLDIPTIGVGAGVHCSGQCLVYHDLLGIGTHPHHAAVAPRFSKQYAQLGNTIYYALRDFSNEVKDRQFPTEEYARYSIPDDQFHQFLDYADSRVPPKGPPSSAHHQFSTKKHSPTPSTTSADDTDQFTLY